MRLLLLILLFVLSLNAAKCQKCCQCNLHPDNFSARFGHNINYIKGLSYQKNSFLDVTSENVNHIFPEIDERFLYTILDHTRLLIYDLNRSNPNLISDLHTPVKYTLFAVQKYLYAYCKQNKESMKTLEHSKLIAHAHNALEDALKKPLSSKHTPFYIFYKNALKKDPNQNLTYLFLEYLSEQITIINRNITSTIQHKTLITYLKAVTDVLYAHHTVEASLSKKHCQQNSFIFPVIYFYRFNQKFDVFADTNRTLTDKTALFPDFDRLLLKSTPIIKTYYDDIDQYSHNHEESPFDPQTLNHYRHLSTNAYVHKLLVSYMNRFFTHLNIDDEAIDLLIQKPLLYLLHSHALYTQLQCAHPMPSSALTKELFLQEMQQILHTVLKEAKGTKNLEYETLIGFVNRQGDAIDDKEHFDNDLNRIFFHHLVEQAVVINRTLRQNIDNKAIEDFLMNLAEVLYYSNHLQKSLTPKECRANALNIFHKLSEI